MYYNGFNYWLTKHGRARFIQRFGPLPDSEIIRIAVNGHPAYHFIWVPDSRYPTTGRRLVTVLLNDAQLCALGSIFFKKEA